MNTALQNRIIRDVRRLARTTGRGRDVTVVDVSAEMNLRAWLDELLAATAQVVVKGDQFGPNSYHILPPTDEALKELDRVRARIEAQMEEAGLA